MLLGLSIAASAGGALASSSAATTVTTSSPSGSSQTQNILDRPIPKGKSEVSESAFLYLFSEIVQYCHTRANGVEELQQKLLNVGHSVGVRFLELQVYRLGKTQRYTELLDLLKFISSSWRILFGKDIDALEQATGSEQTCNITISFFFSFFHCTVVLV